MAAFQERTPGSAIMGPSVTCQSAKYNAREGFPENLQDAEERL